MLRLLLVLCCALTLAASANIHFPLPESGGGILIAQTTDWEGIYISHPPDKGETGHIRLIKQPPSVVYWAPDYSERELGFIIVCPKPLEHTGPFDACVVIPASLNIRNRVREAKQRRQEAKKAATHPGHALEALASALDRLAAAFAYLPGEEMWYKAKENRVFGKTVTADVVRSLGMSQKFPNMLHVENVGAPVDPPDHPQRCKTQNAAPANVVDGDLQELLDHLSKFLDADRYPCLA